MVTENPAPEPERGPTAAAPSAPGGTAVPLTTRLGQLGRNEQLVIGGAAAVVFANLVGGVVEEWSLDVRFWLVILAGIAAAVLVFTGTPRMLAGLSIEAFIRIDAAIVAGYALVDFGDLGSSLGDWSVLSIVLTAIEVVGAAVLAYGAWRVTGGDLLADIASVGRSFRLELVDRFVYFGALGVVVGWFLIMLVADIYRFNTESQIGVLAAVLVLAVRWIGRNPGTGQLPVALPWAIAGLAAIAVLIGLWWLLRIIGDTLEVGDLTTYLPLLLYALALVSLAAGAILGVGRQRAPAAS